MNVSGVQVSKTSLCIFSILLLLLFFFFVVVVVVVVVVRWFDDLIACRC